MARQFAVEIRGGEEQVRDALLDAGIWAGGPPRNQSGGLIAPWVFAVVQAQDEADARSQVAERIAQYEGCTVEHVQPLD